VSLESELSLTSPETQGIETTHGLLSDVPRDRSTNHSKRARLSARGLTILNGLLVSSSETQVRNGTKTEKHTSAEISSAEIRVSIGGH
jgi:hypothetical protein